jgi:hypothetical protein
MASCVSLFLETDTRHILRAANSYPVSYPYAYCYVVNTVETDGNTVRIAVITEKTLLKNTNLVANVFGVLCHEESNSETILCTLNEENISEQTKEYVHWVLTNGKPLSKDGVEKEYRGIDYALELHSRYFLNIDAVLV